MLRQSLLEVEGLATLSCATPHVILNVWQEFEVADRVVVVAGRDRAAFEQKSGWQCACCVCALKDRQRWGLLL